QPPAANLKIAAVKSTRQRPMEQGASRFEPFLPENTKWRFANQAFSCSTSRHLQSMLERTNLSWSSTTSKSFTSRYKSPHLRIRSIPRTHRSVQLYLHETFATYPFPIAMTFNRASSLCQKSSATMAIIYTLPVRGRMRRNTSWMDLKSEIL